MPENLSGKYYRQNKERLEKKKIVKDIKIFRKKKKKQRDHMAVDVAKISQKMKNKSLLSIEENIIE